MVLLLCDSQHSVSLNLLQITDFSLSSSILMLLSTPSMMNSFKYNSQLFFFLFYSNVDLSGHFVIAVSVFISLANSWVCFLFTFCPQSFLFYFLWRKYNLSLGNREITMRARQFMIRVWSFDYSTAFYFCSMGWQVSQSTILFMYITAGFCIDTCEVHATMNTKLWDFSDRLFWTLYLCGFWIWVWLFRNKQIGIFLIYAPSTLSVPQYQSLRHYIVIHHVKNSTCVLVLQIKCCSVSKKMW